jgi:hypothetical protein
MRREVTYVLERWSSVQGNLHAQNAAYRLAWGKYTWLLTGLAERRSFWHCSHSWHIEYRYLSIIRYPGDPTCRRLIEVAIGSGCYLAHGMELLSIFKWVTLIGLVVALLTVGLINAIYLTRNCVSNGALSSPADFQPCSLICRLFQRSIAPARTGNFTPRGRIVAVPSAGMKIWREKSKKKIPSNISHHTLVIELLKSMPSRFDLLRAFSSLFY